MPSRSLTARGRGVLLGTRQMAQVRRRSRQGRRHLGPWSGRLALVAVVAGLAAAGLATATFALGSTTGVVPNHGSMGTSTDEAPQPPPAPAPPPDPLAPPPAPSSAVTVAMKAEAQTNVHQMVPGVAYFCSLALEQAADSNSKLVQSFTGGAYGPGMLRLICNVAIEVLVAQYQIFQDPPAADYTQVVLPSPALVRSVAVSCPKRLSRHDFAALKADVLRHVNALATTAAAADGAAITLDRYSGADGDGADAPELLQAVAEKAYAGELAAALAAQQKAGGALAFLLRRTHLDTHLKTGVLQSLAKKLAAPKGVPQSVVSRLVAAGVTSDATELSQTLTSVLQGVPNLPFSSAIGAGFSGGSLTALYRTLTAPELAVLVHGLAGQGAVSSAAGDVLITDLRQAALAPTPAARAPLLARFATDAGSKVTGPAAALLTVAAQALAG